MRLLLALDCSTDECSLALRSGGLVVAHREFPARQASEQLLEHIDAMLDSCGVDAGGLAALAVGIGPGAFTGVRLAVATVQGMALARSLPIYPISTLAAIARQARVSGDKALPMLVLQDARMGEVYAGWFESDATGVRAISTEIVVNPSKMSRPAQVAGFNVAGNAFAIHPDAVVAAVGSPAQILMAGPIAIGVAELAAIQPASAARNPELVEPAYVRSKVALTTLEQQAVRDTA